MTLSTPLRYLVASGICGLLFVGLAQAVIAGGALVQFDQELARRSYLLAAENKYLWDISLWVSDLGIGRPAWVFGIGIAVVLIARGQCRLALVWAFAQLVGREVNPWLKSLFERPRPFFEGTPFPAGGWSFPSGHAMQCTHLYAMAAYLIFKLWPEGGWKRWLIAAFLGTLIFLIALSRMFLGVHFFSDVLAGTIAGLCWLGLCIALFEWLSLPKPAK